MNDHEKTFPQRFERKNQGIRAAFQQLKKERPGSLQRRLSFAWSNWGFGVEPMAATAARLQSAGISFIELHGDHYGADLGADVRETQTTLSDHGIAVGGICGMFSRDNDLSSNRAIERQAAVDYIRRQLDFASAMGAGYMLVVPGAVGRPAAYDTGEFDRSVETLRLMGDAFAQHGIQAAIEPIRSAEVSFVHTIADAKEYLEAVSHPAIGHINGDVYHMQAEESHIGEALIAAGPALANLHLADSNRCALGDGSLDLDTVIMALYLIGQNTPGRYVTAEPLGPGGDPYPAMYGKHDPASLDKLVHSSVAYFREREEELLA